MDIKTNLANLKNKIIQIAQANQRDPNLIKLIAVSKNQTSQAIRTLVNLGVKDFGENKLQNALPKLLELKDLNLNWHFIGHIQSNKVKTIVANFDYLHSLDSLKILEKTNKVAKELNKKVKVLLEVNISQEKNKFGFEISEVDLAIKKALTFKNIVICGLMTMAPYLADPHMINNIFAELRLLKEQYNLQELSMGMSDDYPIAIAQGATMLRIGTILFDTNSRFINKETI